MTHTPLKIDLQDIIDKRMPASKRRWIPRFFVRGMERLIRQRQLNGILERTFPKRGVEFAQATLDDLNITVNVRGIENIPSSGRCIFVSNHPLGGLDGIALIATFGKIYGDEGIRFPVNDLLMNVEPLSDIFTPINKFGRQGRRGAQGLKDVFASEKQMIFFPAGLVSRLQGGSVVRDLKWHKTFVAKAIENNRTIVPVHFGGENSMKFYRMARWRQRLGIKFNFEQILLPSELVKAAGSTYTIAIGAPITPDELRAREKTPAVLAEEIKNIVYKL